MIRVAAYSPQMRNNTQQKNKSMANNPSFGIKVIQPHETTKGLTFADLLPKVKENLTALVSKKPSTGSDSPFYMAESVKKADGKDSPFHML